MPSIQEPSGISQQEAFMYSCPVIAYCVGGLRETVVDISRNSLWGNGFLFYDYSVEALNETMVKVRFIRQFVFLKINLKIIKE